MVLIFKIIGVAFATCVCVLSIRQFKPELAMLLGIAGGIVILLMLTDGILQVLGIFNSLAEKTGIDSAVASSLIKIIGVGYLTEMASNMAEDSGNKSIAGKIVFAGKIIILVMALPMLETVVNLIVSIL